MLVLGAGCWGMLVATRPLDNSTCWVLWVCCGFAVAILTEQTFSRLLLDMFIPVGYRMYGS
jgi:hypothetical protein